MSNGADSTGDEAHDPAVPAAYADFMRTGWGERPLDVERHPVADRAAERRSSLAQAFPGQRLVVPAGGFKVRSNDTDYRFRSNTAHTWLSGNQTSDAALVLEPDGEAVLFARPRSSRESDEFFRDRQYGELWAGRRPSLGEISESLGLRTRHLDELESTIGDAVVLRGVDDRIDRLTPPTTADADLAGHLAEARLIKDEGEIAELQRACDVTILGFADSVREWDNALLYGERWIEGTFFRRARAMGNDVGYDSIVGGGRHATTLHWIDNSGPITPGDLVLLDMGAEMTSLYTADVTRTLPASRSFTGIQRDLYELVLSAQERGIEALRPGVRFRAAHDAAQEVLAHGLADLGLLPCSAEESLDPSSRVHARWTLHGVSHMLGMDVHDCADASADRYYEGELAAGMVLTVEPGLYFQEDDELVPPELRGIGIRIEDDLLVTRDGSRNLSEGLPRTADDIENWMERLRS